MGVGCSWTSPSAFRPHQEKVNCAMIADIVGHTFWTQLHRHYSSIGVGISISQPQRQRQQSDPGKVG
jgi:hypothetical protein